MVANQETITGNWNQLKGKIRSKWGEMTDDMLEQGKGNLDNLVGTIQHATGEARENIREYLDSCMGECADMYTRASEAVRAGSQQVMEQAQQVGESIKQGADQTSKMIQARPFESVLFTFGAGVIAGLAVGLVLRSK